jgi:hypothetical protein
VSTTKKDRDQASILQFTGPPDNTELQIARLTLNGSD